MANPAVDLDAFDAFEAEGWEESAGAYERFFGGITDRVVARLLDGAAVGVGARVLDVATGPGWVAAHAAQRGASVVGIDIAEAMIARARDAYPGLECRRADAHELPFPDASFDAVVGNLAVMHLSRPERAMAEFTGGRSRRQAGTHGMGSSLPAPVGRGVSRRDGASTSHAARGSPARA